MSITPDSKPCIRVKSTTHGGGEMREKLFRMLFIKEAKELDEQKILNKKLSNQVRLKQTYIDQLNRELKRRMREK